MNLPALIAAGLSSTLVVLMAYCGFRSKPATRRLFLLVLPIVLLAVPTAVRLLPWHIDVGLVDMGFPLIDLAFVDSLWLGLLVSGAVLALVQVARMIHANRRLRTLPGIVNRDRVEPVLLEYAQALRLDKPIDVRTGSEACSTSFGGCLIVLPASWSEWQEETLRAVLAHELVHLRRRDDQWLGFSWFVVHFFWWLPWMRAIPRLLVRAVEESCDDLASFLVRSDAVYLDGVYQVAKQQSATPAFTTGVAGSPVLARFQRFSEFRDQQIDSRGLYWAVLIALLLVCSLWSVRFSILDSDRSTFRVVGTTQRSADSTDIVVQLREAPASRPGTDATRNGGEQPGHDPPSP